MQLQHFAAFDKTAAQSLITRPCTLINLYGNYAGAGNEFLQVFDKATAAVANDVPVISLSLAAGQTLLPSFFEALGARVFTLGLSVGVSLVNEKYTASGSSFDIEGDVEAIEVAPTLTTVGDLTTGVSLLQVWAQASGPKRLYSIETASVAGLSQNSQLCLFAKDSNADGTAPIWSAPITVAAQSLVFNFGAGGLWVRETISNVLYEGCTICLSTDLLTGHPGGLVQSSDTIAIRAKYLS